MSILEGFRIFKKRLQNSKKISFISILYDPFGITCFFGYKYSVLPAVL